MGRIPACLVFPPVQSKEWGMSFGVAKGTGVHSSCIQELEKELKLPLQF